jgi:hypothetical protein
MSFFTRLYPSRLLQKDFWSSSEKYQLSIFPLPPKFQSKLSFLYKSEFLTEQLVKLNSKFLYFQDKDGNLVYCKLKTATFNTFFEESSEPSVFGFSIRVNSEVKQDFYVNSEDCLKTWFKVLSKLVILTSIEQDYLIIKNIDSGKFGSVKLCQSTSNEKQKKYALKEVKKDQLEDLKILQHLFNEISFLKKFKHKNIIKLYRVYEDFDNVYLVLEYVPHGNLLKRIISRKKLSESEVAMFARKLFKTLEYIHGFGILHRDLKLENILMSHSKKCYKFKIADFGLSCFIDKSKKMKSGSPGYMAPEILRGQPYSTKIDIFSAGVIIYTLLSGGCPFLSHTPEKTLEQNTLCQINFESKLLKHLSDSCINFMRKILCPDSIIRPTAGLAKRDNWISKQKQKKPVSQTCETIKNRQAPRILSRVVSRLIIF